MGKDIGVGTVERIEYIMWHLVSDADEKMLAARNKAEDFEARYPDNEEELDDLNAEADARQTEWYTLVQAYKSCFGKDWTITIRNPDE